MMLTTALLRRGSAAAGFRAASVATASNHRNNDNRGASNGTRGRHGGRGEAATGEVGVRGDRKSRPSITGNQRPRKPSRGPKEGHLELKGAWKPRDPKGSSTMNKKGKGGSHDGKGGFSKKPWRPVSRSSPDFHLEVIRSAVSEGSWRAAENAFDVMKKAGIRPERHHFELLMQVHSTLGHLGKVMSWMNQMKKHRIIPTPRAYAAVLHGVSKAEGTSLPKKREVVAKVLLDLEKNTVPPSPRLNNALVECCLRVGLTNEATQYLERMSQDSDKGGVGDEAPKDRVFGSFIHAFEGSGELDAAYEVAHRLQKAGVLPGSHTMDAWLHATVHPKDDLILTPRAEDGTPRTYSDDHEDDFGRRNFRREAEEEDVEMDREEREEMAKKEMEKREAEEDAPPKYHQKRKGRMKSTAPGARKDLPPTKVDVLSAFSIYSTLTKVHGREVDGVVRMVTQGPGATSDSEVSEYVPDVMSQKRRQREAEGKWEWLPQATISPRIPEPLEVHLPNWKASAQRRASKYAKGSEVRGMVSSFSRKFGHDALWESSFVSDEGKNREEKRRLRDLKEEQLKLRGAVSELLRRSQITEGSPRSLNILVHGMLRAGWVPRPAVDFVVKEARNEVGGIRPDSTLVGSMLSIFEKVRRPMPAIELLTTAVKTGFLYDVRLRPFSKEDMVNGLHEYKGDINVPQVLLLPSRPDAVRSRGDSKTKTKIPPHPVVWEHLSRVGRMTAGNVESVEAGVELLELAVSHPAIHIPIETLDTFAHAAARVGQGSDALDLKARLRRLARNLGEKPTAYAARNLR